MTRRCGRFKTPGGGAESHVDQQILLFVESLDDDRAEHVFRGTWRHTSWLAPSRHPTDRPTSCPIPRMGPTSARPTRRGQRTIDGLPFPFDAAYLVAVLDKYLSPLQEACFHPVLKPAMDCGTVPPLLGSLRIWQMTTLRDPRQQCWGFASALVRPKCLLKRGEGTREARFDR